VDEDDVYFCYRLLLEREPDPEGARQWAELVARGLVSLPALVDGFLHSPERRALEARRREPRPVELEGFRIWVRPDDPHIGLPIARDRSYEPHVTRALRARLRPGDTFVDVGANVGYFTLLAATRVGGRGRVIAFEPRPDNVELLRRSLADSGFAHVVVHACAVAERAQEIAFFASGELQSNGRLWGEGEPGGDALPTVRAVALDEALADEPRVDLIKMDIEGAEPRALAGMHVLLRTHRPALLTEFCPDLLRATSGVEPVAYLEALAAGHDLYVVPHDGGRELGPLAPERIVALHAASGRTHLDLAAQPRG
jgi:FkbM family methyltransferase